jgi:hypothetical protein
LVEAWVEFEFEVALYSSNSKVELAKYFSSFSFLRHFRFTLKMKTFPRNPFLNYYFLLFLCYDVDIIKELSLGVYGEKN